MAKNEEIDNWLYEEGFDATKSVYAEKLKELKTLGGPLEKRQIEGEGRATALSGLQSALSLYQTWINGAAQQAEHITDEEREKFRSLTDSTSAWMYELMDKQGSLNLSDDPVLMVSDIDAKKNELNTICGPIMRKPVPVPKKEVPPPPKEEAKTGTPMEGVEGNEGKAESAPMETD